MKDHIKKKILVLLLFFYPVVLFSEELKEIRIGTLQYGSVNWELDVIKHLKLDEKNNINVKTVKLASKNAAAVALQGKAVDLIVTDWFWVSRQRSQKRMFSFVPHSMSAGGLIVNKNSTIKSVEDLKNKKIGIAGGQVDKSWLIFRAFYKENYGNDLVKDTEQIFGAPPLLNKKIEQGSFDAILTYWPYQARLLASDFKRIINITDIVSELGISSNVPIIGWVFRDDFGVKNSEALERFLKTSNEAKKIMMDSDDIWEVIKPTMRAENNETFIKLKEIYREGIPEGFNSKQVTEAKLLYRKLGEIGGKELIGNSPELSSGTFWKK